MKRPTPSYREFKYLREKLHGADAMTIQMGLSKTLEYGDYSVEDVRIIGATHDFGKIYGFEFKDGRYFSMVESKNGTEAMVIGAGLAEELFPPNTDPVGKEIRSMNRKFKIIGVLKNEGESIIETGFDDNAAVPFNFLRKIVDVNSKYAEAQISVRAREDVTLAELTDELRGVMRAIRKLRPKEEDDFAINQMTMITGHIDGMFIVLNIAGWIIGGFAILVGGFGIANIMFVSVRERTNIIGIKKSLGAKNYIILLEFIFEAIILCLIGGLLGLILVLIETIVANYLIEGFTFYLTSGNIILGLIVSIVIGLISGFWPALVGARMNPVDAIRFK